MKQINIFWFRRDLRFDDNIGLYQALQRGNVLPVFIFDRNILDKLSNTRDHRINFIHREVLKLKNELEKIGSSLLVFHDTPRNVFKDLVSKYKIQAVFFNHDYEPYAIERDDKISRYLKSHGIETHSFKDQVIFEKSEVVKNDEKPYTVFTPYSRKWKSELKKIKLPEYNTKEIMQDFIKTSAFEYPKLKDLGFIEFENEIPPKEFNKDIISNYHLTRDIPSVKGTSRLSVHLRFGTISIRKLVKLASQLNETFLNELIWREFYMIILWHFPHVITQSFKKKYDLIEWRNNEQEFELWKIGKTGYPIVDAGMRELNNTGFMHNRLRMITASFLTKHLLIDWRWGEAYFGEKLMDYELSSNNGGWQWAASTGCDAVPYFRIFNPEKQTEKFDKDLTYISKWIPELNSPDYPKPIVEHKFARDRALETYKRLNDL